MRMLSLAGLLFCGVASLAQENADKKKVLEQLQGEWKVEKALLGGKDLTEPLQKQKFTFTADKLKLHDPDRDTTQELPFEIDVSAKPPLIDMTSKDNEKFEGIFVLKGDDLRICIALQAGNRPLEFASPDDSKIALVEFKRVKK